MGRRLVCSWVVALLLAASGAAVFAGDGLVALQTAAPSCADDSGDRYVNCGNGTVTDNQTGLVWLANANCFGVLNWFEAMAAVAGLGDLDCSVSEGDGCDCGLGDGSSPGEWRLPSRREWKGTIADAVALGCTNAMFGGPSITDDSGTQCWQEGPGNSFTGVEVSSSYWSASTLALNPPNAFDVYLFSGGVGNGNKTIANFYVWPVRGGP